MKIEESGSQNHKDKSGSAPTVENNAKYKYNNIFQFFRNEIVGKNKRRQKKEDKEYAAENH